MDNHATTEADERALPLSDRARRFGYIIWPKKRQQEVSIFLNARERVNVVWAGVELGEKRVDHKYCRISVGRKALAGVPVGDVTLGLSVYKVALRVQVR